MLSLPHTHQVGGDGSSDLRGCPGKLLELQADGKASFNVHNWWVRFPTSYKPPSCLQGPSSKNQAAGSLRSWLGSRFGDRDVEKKYKQ